MSTPDRLPASSREATRDSLTLRTILALIGFTAVIAQIVLMRELIVVFYGNEISLGVMLANWLLWTAVGASLLGRIVGRARQTGKVMAALQVLTAVAFPLTIFAVRASKAAFHSIPGEIMGPGPMLLTSFVALSFFCAVSGCLFTAGSRLYADAAGATTALATGTVYLLEAIGSGIGGILASLVFIPFLSSFEVASIVALMNLLAALTILIRVKVYRWAAAAMLIGVFAFLMFPFGNGWLERLSLAYLWRGFRVIETRNSVYGNLAVVQTEQSRSLFENGLVFATVPDPAAAEEAVHYALLQHPSPKSLLLVGGGVNGSVTQALRHQSLQRVDYVELDPTVLDIAREHFPNEWRLIETDPRVRVRHTDGRLFLKTSAGSYDVIIVNLPDPQTAQLNRFYTEEFFREASQRLNSGGLLSFQVTGAENYISDDLAQFLRCVNKTLRAVFPEVTAIPGATVHFFAATQAGVLAIDLDALLQRLSSRQLQTSYVREYFIPFRMAPDRVLDLQLQMEPQADTPINRDFAPVAYYFDVALWSSRFHRGYSQLFESIASLKLLPMASAAAAVLFAFVGLAQWRCRRNKVRSDSHGSALRVTAGFSVAAMGFTLLALEMLLLLGFQAIYGYVYQQLAIVIGAFMVGLALGSWWEMRGANLAAATRPTSGEESTSACLDFGTTARKDARRLAALQVLAALSPLLLYGLFAWFARISSPTGLAIVSRTLFPLLALLSGMLGGYQFPLASRIYFSGSKNAVQSPGTLYGLDLVAACLGALLLSVYLFPVFGFLRTAILIAVLNSAPTVQAILSARDKQARRVEAVP